MSRFFAALILLLPSLLQVSPSPWQLQTTPVAERLRGVSAVSDRIAWASGNKGTVLRTTDAGATWALLKVPDAEKLDFRDIEAFDANTAYILAIGSGDASRIYKTTDGGATWTLQFKASDPKAFFDAIAFWDAQHGLAIGDPVDGHATVIRTEDGGQTWVPVAASAIPAAIEGDGSFAASGTILVAWGSKHAWFGTGGGAKARVFRTSDGGKTWQVGDTPVMAGNASSGVFSLSFADAKRGIAVGGDYRKEQGSGDNIALTVDGGATWSLPNTRLRSFRSAVAYIPGTNGRSLLAAGPGGTDRSDDGGATWRAIGDEGFHALSIERGGRAAWAVGEKGRVARIELKGNQR